MLPMSKNLSILVAQLDPVVGDIKGNLALARGALAEGAAAGVDLAAVDDETGLAWGRCRVDP